MVLEDLIQVNRLWRKIYPYLAMQTAGIYRRDCGDVLELGPFSGGISLELAGRYPGLNITIADNSSEVLNYFNEEIRSAGLTANIRTRKTGLNPLVFNDAEFDLVIVRGAFFFLDEDGNILREIFRVIRKGGIAFAGGGFGKDTPKDIIDEIAEESRVLNDRLGRKRVRIQGLEQIISRARLTDNCRIVEEGGLWVIVRK
jgi:ubiquinone/menaquinone biosynthesis C-methylase UbiE